MREQLGEKREGEIVWRDGGIGDEISVEGESLFMLGGRDEGFDDCVRDECVGVLEEREKRDGDSWGERGSEAFDEMAGDERVVTVAGDEELGEDLGDERRRSDEGVEGNENWVRVRVLLGPN